jgi:hypothetical protein
VLGTKIIKLFLVLSLLKDTLETVENKKDAIIKK